MSITREDFLRLHRAFCDGCDECRDQPEDES